ncbi:MAG: rod shape-determining protein MreD [Bacteroidales bacterium]|nr:rod shape-determining protein MreD [Bacteroidales bacterium]
MDLRAYGKVVVMYIVLVLLQVMVINNIIIGTWGITPMLYVLFVLALPLEMPGWVLLLSSFLMGYTIDVFVDTPGLNSGASVAMAFARPWILNMISPRDGYESGKRPYLMDMGAIWFLIYSAALVLIHHVVYFIFDEFGLAHFFSMMGKILVTAICTEILVVISQYIAFRK